MQTQTPSQTDLYHALVDDSPTGMVALAFDGTLLAVNARMRELCGAHSAIRGRLLVELIAPSARPSFEEHFAEAKSGAKPRFEIEFLREDGSAFIAGMTLYPLEREGETIGVGARVHDRTLLTETAQRRLENQQSLRLRRLYLAAASAGRTPANQIQATLEAGIELLRMKAAYIAEIVGEELILRYRAGAPGGLELGTRLKLSDSYIRHALAHREVLTIEDLTAPQWRSDHDAHGRGWTSWAGTPVERFGKLYGTLAFCGDEPGGHHFHESDKDLVQLMGALCGSTLERLAHEERLGALAFYDALTGLPNRVLFDDRVAQTLVAARRHQQKFAIMYLDLDDFKDVNDAHGHAAGDEVLRVAARRLQSIARESDTVARQGGDEFVLLQRFVRSAQDATRLARRVNEALRQPIAIDDAIVFVSASIGIALYPDDGTDTQSLLAHADAALYQAKAAGRDRAVLYAAAVTPETPA